MSQLVSKPFNIQNTEFISHVINKYSGAIQTKAARFFRYVLSVPEHSHISRKTLDAAGILVL